jgi:threonine/homoserine/homoserine lactone efflux protein
MTRYHITTGKSSGLQLLKSAVVGLLVLSTIMGVFLAALAIGSVIAILLLVVVFMSTIVWFIWRLWYGKRSQGRRDAKSWLKKF